MNKNPQLRIKNFIIVIILMNCFLIATSQEAETAFSRTGGTTGLKDVNSIGVEQGAQGAFFICLGEDFESKSGSMIIVSAGKRITMKSNKIEVEFEDFSTRTFIISKATRICNKKDKSITLNKISTGDTISVRWKTNNQETIRSNSDKVALSIKLGGMKYKFIEPNGKLTPSPIKLVKNSCL